jgi:hypothetical protein
MDGATVLGTVPLGADQSASLTVTTLAPGTHALVALYLGTTNFDSSASAPVILEVVTPSRHRSVKH